MIEPQPHLRIRFAAPEDLAAVVRIENRSFSDPWSVESLVGELEADRLRLPLVAEYGGEVWGYLMAWRIADQLHILNIATDPRQLRRGVGTALLLAAGRMALAEGLSEMTLEVRRSNSAAGFFYRRHGFVEVGIRKGYYADNGEDAVVMTCHLTDLVADR